MAKLAEPTVEEITVEGDPDKQLRGLFASVNRVTPGPPQRDANADVLVVPADGTCLHHCVAAAEDVTAWAQQPLEWNERRAKKTKDEFILYLRAKSLTDNATRLLQPGRGANFASVSFFRGGKGVSG